MENLLEKPMVSTQNNYPIFKQNVPQRIITAGNYQLRFARSQSELEEIQRLRYTVFVADGNPDGMDADRFDEVCHHLLVRHMPSQKIVGTYRMQFTEMAEANYGFYSNQEYCLEDIPQPVLSDSVEIGRVCVEEAHRNGRVLHLLWRGLATYLEWNNKRYLFGCSSLFSQDVREGYAVLEAFKKEGQLHDSIWVNTRPAYTCEYHGSFEGIELKVPKLLRVYMMFGAKVCSPPALDKEFKSIDFLTLFDLRGLSERAYNSFFAD